MKNVFFYIYISINNPFCGRVIWSNENRNPRLIIRIKNGNFGFHKPYDKIIICIIYDCCGIFGFKTIYFKGEKTKKDKKKKTNFYLNKNVIVRDEIVFVFYDYSERKIFFKKKLIEQILNLSNRLIFYSIA